MLEAFRFFRLNGDDWNLYMEKHNVAGKNGSCMVFGVLIFARNYWFCLQRVKIIRFECGARLLAQFFEFAQWEQGHGTDYSMQLIEF